MDAAKVMEVLRQVEWVKAGDLEEFCLSCEWNNYDGHADDCKLAALLAEAEKEEWAQQYTAHKLAEIEAMIRMRLMDE